MAPTLANAHCRNRNGCALASSDCYPFLTVRPALDAISTRVHGLTPSLAWYDFANASVER